MTPKSDKSKERRKRNLNRKLLRKVRNEAMVNGEPEPDIQPDDALQYCLDRAMHMLKNAMAGVADLKPDEVWRDTQMGRIPNEWIRLEQDLREEVTKLAGNMISLDIEGRRVDAAQAVAAVLAPVFEHFIGELDLTKKQEKLAPKAVVNSLKLLEGGRTDDDS